MNRLNNFEKLAVFGGVGSTLIINPWFQLDPINIPKMVLVVTTSAFLAPRVFISMKSINKIERLVISASFLFTVTLIIAISQSDVLLTQQIWGTWGRSTGLATYIAFIIIFLAFLFLSNDFFRTKVRLIFERVGYVVSGYAIMQWAELDPVDWSQKALVSTLGNINFMSSLVGLVSISYVARVLFESCAIYTKFFYFFIIVLNMFLIFSSKSIQGIAIVLAGSVLSGSFYLRDRKTLGVSALFLFSSSALGFLGLLGTASIGPLRFLRQETVIYRMDYWRAAVRMIRDNPWFGVGVDSYGDFYRFYRDEAAISRTGPQRVTDTAHNIFLDIGSGAGVFALLSFLIIFCVAFYVTLSALSRNAFDKDSIFWSAQFVGFIVFCLISINQIGVGVWGFIAMGLVIGTARTSKDTRDEFKTHKRESVNNKSATFISSKATRQVSTSAKFHRESTVLIAAHLIFGFTVLVFAGQQAHIDWSLNKAIQNRDLDAAYKISFASSAQDRHREIIFTKLKEAGRQSDALKLAQRATQLNDRNWEAWVFSLSSDVSSAEEKEKAALKLLELDPKNILVRQELRSILP